MPRSFIGNVPAEPYKLLNLNSPLPGDWDLYGVVYQNEVGILLSLKLVSKVARERKANYWLGWYGNQERWVRNGDIKHLSEHQPALMVMVEQCARELVRLGPTPVARPPTSAKQRETRAPA